MSKKLDPRIMHYADAYPCQGRRTGFVVDLSEGTVRNPDCFFLFRTLREAQTFLRLIDSGVETHRAYFQV